MNVIIYDLPKKESATCLTCQLCFKGLVSVLKLARSIKRFVNLSVTTLDIEAFVKTTALPVSICSNHFTRITTKNVPSLQGSVVAQAANEIPIKYLGGLIFELAF